MIIIADNINKTPDQTIKIDANFYKTPDHTNKLADNVNKPRRGDIFIAKD